MGRLTDAQEQELSEIGKLWHKNIEALEKIVLSVTTVLISVIIGFMKELQTIINYKLYLKLVLFGSFTFLVLSLITCIIGYHVTIKQLWQAQTAYFGGEPVTDKQHRLAIRLNSAYLLSFVLGLFLLLVFVSLIFFTI